MRYFAKLNPEILPPTLRPGQFERLIPGWGHLATEDPAILAVIDAHIGKAYAFYEIKEEDYQAAKKVPSEPVPPSSPRNQEPLSPKPPEPRPPAPAQEASPAVATEPAAPAPPPALRRSPLAGRTTPKSPPPP